MQRLWLSLCFCGVAFVVTSASAEPTLFSATIAPGGTCAITFNPAGTLTLDSTDASSAIDATSPPILSIKKTTLMLTSCTGWSGGRTPTLTVSGPTSRDNKVMANRQFLLKSEDDAGGNSKGFGFVMGKAETGIIDWDTGGGTGMYSFTYPVDLPLAEPGTTLANNTTKDIYFGLSCGTSASCASANVSAGTLNATVEFTFAYK